MKRLILFAGLALGSGLSCPVGAQTIDLRVSVHVILNATTGARPAGITDQVFYTAAENANDWMAGYYRGYRYRITEVTNVGGPSGGGVNGPSKWYGQDFRNDPQWSQFQSEAVTNTQYRLRSNQINVYIASGFSAPGNSGGGTPIPPGDLRTAVQIFADDGAWWLAHELGHFFGLSHTFAGDNQSTCTPGDDGISDTLSDSRCWTSLDMVASYHYSSTYAALNAAQKEQVNNVYYNAMSYHDYLNKNTTENRKTELQLDREADHANGDRNVFVSGHTRFVSTAGSDSDNGASTSPYRTLAKGVGVASSGGNDIILLRPGTYNEKLTISKPVTLRVPRTGWATIGR